MLKTMIAVILAVAAGSALAAPIVIAGSQYSILVGGDQSGQFYLTNTFDGNDDVFALPSQNVTVSESETIEAANLYRITLRVTGQSDLFPIAGEMVYAGVGIDGDGLDLSTSVFLEDARLRYLAGSDVVYSSGNLAEEFRAQFFTGPWTGYFAAPLTPFSTDEASGRNVTVYELDFLVSVIPGTALPEPGTLALMLAALPAAMLARRRRR